MKPKNNSWIPKPAFFQKKRKNGVKPQNNISKILAKLNLNNSHQKFMVTLSFCSPKTWKQPSASSVTIQLRELFPVFVALGRLLDLAYALLLNWYLKYSKMLEKWLRRDQITADVYQNSYQQDPWWSQRILQSCALLDCLYLQVTWCCCSSKQSTRQPNRQRIGMNEFACRLHKS